MGGIGSGRRSTATIECPDHPGSRVKRDGRYGPEDHKRQRHRCFPNNGDRSHAFTESLPREEAWEPDCHLCEQDVAHDHGPHAAKRYQFVARGIAEALQMVGTGTSYLAASRVTRERARRYQTDRIFGRTRNTNHGQLVADFVEVFAPVVFESHRPDDWPSGTLVLDESPFVVKAFKPDGSPRQGGQRAFTIYEAMGYDDDGEAKLWRLEAFRDSDQRHWERFLRRLGSAPDRVVCDGQYSIANAVRAVWPHAEIYISEWHLKDSLKQVLTRDVPKNFKNRCKRLLAEVPGCMRNSATWDQFIADMGDVGYARLDRWVKNSAPLVGEQIERRDAPGYRQPNKPLSTGGLETKTRVLKGMLDDRAHLFKNRERLNRLLMLIQLHMNEQDNWAEHSKSIRQWLEANGGRPIVPRRAVADPDGAPTLGPIPTH